MLSSTILLCLWVWRLLACTNPHHCWIVAVQAISWLARLSRINVGIWGLIVYSDSLSSYIPYQMAEVGVKKGNSRRHRMSTCCRSELRIQKLAFFKPRYCIFFSPNLWNMWYTRAILWTKSVTVSFKRTLQVLKNPHSGETLFLSNYTSVAAENHLQHFFLGSQSLQNSLLAQDASFWSFSSIWPLTMELWFFLVNNTSNVHLSWN